MLKVLYPPGLKTSSLRSVRYGMWPQEDQIVTKMGQHRSSPRSTKKIIGRPRIGWMDDWDRSGKHYSMRAKRLISGKIGHRSIVVSASQERKFKYAPAISWDNNPASWDIWDFSVDRVIEILPR